MRTQDLTGAQLDWAVAKCEDILHPWGYIRVQDGRTMWITPGDHETADAWHQYSPSTDWAQGGPIIEREFIELRNRTSFSGGWEAWKWLDENQDYLIVGKQGHYCSTPLIAAMRCLVASKLGDEVEVPDQLGKT